eukprot:GGOE01002524.1.p1 GENE.GGOE01002524.1~~GGOE01002524.1.p1  ORF type:complete len:479 (+),score=170.01 GGOE01002524.1:161-1438(+)
MAAKYERLHVVGRGSFGEAVLVRELATGAEYVSKEVGMAAMSARDRQEAINEVRFLSNLSHPNIIQYVESFLHTNVLYIVMEYADGGDLWELIQARLRQGKRLEESEVLSYFTQVCMALKYMHDRKMLHRDLKTGNVFLTSDGAAKLGDFGISTVMTTTMALANTGKPYNNKADIWALGCILFEMMSGRLAFEGNTMQELCTKILNCELKPLPECYSPELRALCHRILCQQQAMRPTATALLRSYVIVGYLSDLKARLVGQEYEEEAWGAEVEADAKAEASGVPHSVSNGDATTTRTPKKMSPQKAKAGLPEMDNDLEEEMETILQQLEGPAPRSSPKKPELHVRSPNCAPLRMTSVHHSIQVDQLLEELQQVGMETDLTFGDAKACPSVEAFSRSFTNFSPRRDPSPNESIDSLIEEEMKRLSS